MFEISVLLILIIGVITYGIITIKIINAIHEGQKNYYTWLKNGGYREIDILEHKGVTGISNEQHRLAR